MNILSNFNMQEKILLFYLMVINIITFLAFFIDKLKAKKNSWRISEVTLLILSILGGSSGALLGMLVCKHKLSKVKFTIVVPFLFLIHRLLEIYVFNYLR